MTSTTELLQDYCVTVTYYVSLPATTPEDQIEDMINNIIWAGEGDVDSLDWEPYSDTYKDQSLMTFLANRKASPGDGLAALLT